MMYFVSPHKKTEKITLIGRLLKDADIRCIEGNFYLLMFSLAADIIVEAAGGDIKKQQLYRIVLWHHLGDFALAKLKQRSLIYLEGHTITCRIADGGEIITELAGSELLLLSN